MYIRIIYIDDWANSRFTICFHSPTYEVLRPRWKNSAKLTKIVVSPFGFHHMIIMYDMSHVNCTRHDSATVATTGSTQVLGDIPRASLT